MDDKHLEVLQACDNHSKGGTFMPHDIVQAAVPHKDESGIKRQLDIGACIYNLEKDEYLTWNIHAGMKIWRLTEAGRKVLHEDTATTLH